MGNSYIISWNPPTTRDYIISYWYRANGKWLLRRQPYTGSSITLTGGDAYDDVIIYPVDAHVTTYTYDPLRGLTSQTDPSGRTTFYEYDSLGRLQRVRDEQGRILTEQEYHYARP